MATSATAGARAQHAWAGMQGLWERRKRALRTLSREELEDEEEGAGVVGVAKVVPPANSKMM